MAMKAAIENRVLVSSESIFRLYIKANLELHGYPYVQVDESREPQCG